MKYAVWTPADQTIVFVDNDDNHTVIHAKARLFHTKSDAESYINPRNLLGEDEIFFIEEIEDVEEFCNRKDTW